MGTLEQIRKTSPYALGLFALLFVGFMVASDADISNLIKQGSNYQTAVLGEINGSEILYKEYEEKVKEQVEQQQRNAKGEDSQINEAQIRRDVWNQMVEELLLKQEADKAGIFVSNDQILDVLLENPPDYFKKPFTDSTGNFNKGLYLELITNPDKLADYMGKNAPAEKVQEQIISFKKDILMIEKFLRQQMLSNSVMSMVNSSSSILSPAYVSERYLAENSQADVDYLFFDANAIPATSLNVTDQEISAYYDKHKSNYKQKESRKLKYVRFAIRPSLDDTIRAGKKIDKIVADLALAKTQKEKDSIFDVKLSEFSGSTVDYTLASEVDKSIMTILDSLTDMQVTGPIRSAKGLAFYRLDGRRKGENEVVKASHILINFGTNKDSAKAEAERILGLAKKGDFAELANTYSQDKGTAPQGGDLGWFGKGKMVKEFEDAALPAAKGSIVGPVESQFGYHIIKVIDKNSEEIKYSQIEISPNMSNSTRNSIFREAFSFQKQLADGSNFDSLAKKLNIISAETPLFIKHQPVLGSQYLADMAFDAKVGTSFEPIELKNYGIVVAQLVEERNAGSKPLADVKEDIKRKLIHIKQLDAQKQTAETMYQKVKGSMHLANAKASDPTLNLLNAPTFKNDGNVPNVGADFVFSAKVFSMPVTTISEPIRGTRGYYIIEVKSKLTPDMAAAEGPIYTYKIQMLNTMKQREFYDWFSKVKETADIKDMRSKFFKEY
jgi:parvulin-like peptidyl-prolyl isomerase